MKITIVFLLSCVLIMNANCQSLMSGLRSPVIFKGNDSTAYRDPAIIYQNKTFYLFFTLVETETDGKVFSYTATSRSNDLKNWSASRKITPRDQNLNFSSPGNVLRVGDEWVLCLQTYPRPDYYDTQPTRYGNENARIFIMRSNDLEHWGKPEILMVKGKNVSVSEMDRMIDPYLLEDKDEEGKIWCFFKQNGVSMSWSTDLKNWTFEGTTEGGENVCVLIENGEYILFHSPANGIDIKKSGDLEHWKSLEKVITLGQGQWNWAKGRITAGTVINLKDIKGIENYLMFFHGSGPLTEEEGDFDKNASIGIAWSKDLINWEWPQSYSN